MKRLFIPIFAFFLCQSAQAKLIYLTCSETDLVNNAGPFERPLVVDVPMFVDTDRGFASRDGEYYKLTVHPRHYSLFGEDWSKWKKREVGSNSSKHVITIDRSTLKFRHVTSIYIDGYYASTETVGMCLMSEPNIDNQI